VYEYRATLDRVVDGDTIDVIMDLGFGVYSKQRIRLAVIDCPEMNSSDESQRALAKQAKEFVEQLIAKHGTELVIRTAKSDKYGRYIGYVRFYDDHQISIHEELLKSGLAAVYSK